MTGPLTIPEGRHRLVWVFAVDLPKSETDAFRTRARNSDGTVDWPLASALGLTSRPDHEFVELFDVSEISEYGFARYLSDANQIDIGEDARQLDAITGHVLLVFSQALADGETAFHLRPPLSLIGRYGQIPTDWAAKPMDTVESAQPFSAPPQLSPRSARSQARRIGGSIFAFVMLALVLVILWVAL